MNNILEKRAEFDKIMERFREELGKLRTGRASTAQVEGVKIDYFGQPTELRGLASISIPEPRQILVTPWDKSILSAIEKAIRESGLGFNPANEGDKIRIMIPTLTEERRKELVKVCSRTAEEARVRVRNLREELLKTLRQEKDAGAISEDEFERQKKLAQEVVDEYNEKIKKYAEQKEKEIITV